MPFTAWADSNEESEGVLTPLKINVEPLLLRNKSSLTWHTKDNVPFINERLEPDLYAFIKNKVVEDRQTYFHAIGGIADHVHLAASFFPPFEPDTWIGADERCKLVRVWQIAILAKWLWVVSFGTRDLERVVSYIRNQKERHRTGRISERLERFLGEPKGR